MNIFRLAAAAVLSASLITPTASLAASKGSGNNKGTARVEGKASKKTVQKAQKQKAQKQKAGKKDERKRGKNTAREADLRVKQGEKKVFSGEENQTFDRVTGEPGSTTVFK